MKVLIAGGTGFIGSSIVRRFINENSEVHIYLRKTSNLWRINNIKDQINMHFGELSSIKLTDALISSLKPDIVINCSGVVKGFSLNDQNLVIQSNFSNTVNLINACLKSDVETFINTGTSYEYGFSKDAIPMNTSHSGKPIGLYGIVKRAEAEYIKMVDNTYSKNYINLRLFTPYGFYDAPFRLIPYVILSLIEGHEPQIVTPQAGRSFIYLEDVAKIYYAVAKNPEQVRMFNEVNIGDTNLTKVKDIVSKLYDLFNLHYSYNDIGSTKSEAEYMYPERDELVNLLSCLNIELTSLGKGLEKTVNWFKENIKLYVNKNIESDVK